MAKCLSVVWFRGGQQGSVLSFGEVDNSLYQGQIYWTPVTAETYWQIGVQGSVLFNISLISSINWSSDYYWVILSGLQMTLRPYMTARNILHVRWVTDSRSMVGRPAGALRAARPSWTPEPPRWQLQARFWVTSCRLLEPNRASMEWWDKQADTVTHTHTHSWCSRNLGYSLSIGCTIKESLWTWSQNCL